MRHILSIASALLILTIGTVALAHDGIAGWQPTGGAAVPGFALGATPSPVVDAEGDAIDVLGGGGFLLDIDTLAVSFTALQLVIDLGFHHPISPASTQAANSLIGVVEFDTDQSTATGDPPIQNFFPPLPALLMGVDYLIDLASDFFHPGFADVYQLSPGGAILVGVVPTIYTETAVHIEVSLDLLGDDDGLVDFTSVVGNFFTPTDAMDVVGFSVPAGTLFLRGDCNGTGSIDIVDPIFLLQAQFTGGGPIECEDACDANDDGTIDLADAMVLLGYSFIQGPPPPAPFLQCGIDPTDDDTLECDSYPSCTE